MTKTFVAVAAAAFALAVAPASRAQFAIRAGAEAPLVTHVSGSGSNSGSVTSSIGDNFQPAINAMLSFGILPMLSLDAELSEQFQTSTSNGQSSRIGTYLRPGVTFSPIGLPIYFRAAVPIHLEPSPVTTSLRGAVGLAASFPGISPYIEAIVDFPLFSGTGGPNAFAAQQLSLGAGIQIKL